MADGCPALTEVVAEEEVDVAEGLRLSQSADALEFVKKRWLDVYREQNFHDVTFRVGQLDCARCRNASQSSQESQSDEQCCSDIHAHRAVLCSASPVFKAMFTGPMATKGCITIMDTSPAAFHGFLEALYTGDAPLSGYLDAMDLLYLAQKYLVDDVKLQCREYLMSSDIPAQDLLFAMERLSMVEDEAVQCKVRSCWRQQDIEPCLRSKRFQELQQGTILDIVSDDNLKCDEIDIFEAVVNWGRAQCRDVSSKEELRSVLSPLLAHIRLQGMEHDLLCQRVYPCGVFTNTEFLSLILHKSGVDNDGPIETEPKYSWNSLTPREWSVDCTVTRFEDKCNGSWGVGPGRVDYLDFMIDQDAKLCGISLFNYDGLEFNVRLSETQNKKTIHSSTGRGQPEKTKHLFESKDIVQLVANCRYTLEYECVHRNSIPYGKNAGSVVQTEYIKVTFMNTNTSSGNGTTTRDGQFAALHFRINRPTKLRDDPAAEQTD